MTKFSVKKPLTVFVAIVIVLIFGFISFSKMTPDLMPNIDMPYVIVNTVYQGASAEKVEKGVSIPLEKALGTLENLKNINSTSNENYSTVVLEFNENVNMDSITVDILQKISMVEGSFDDNVAKPTIMKINPNMMPIMVAAIEADGMNSYELSKFVSNEILPKLEAIPGVVSISSTGLLQEELSINLDNDKIKSLNKSIFGSLNDDFSDKENEINDSEKELEDAKEKLDKAKIDLEKSQNKFAEQMANANSNLSKKEKELFNTKINLNKKIQELEQQLLDLKTQKNELEKTKNSIDELKENIKTTENSILILKQTKLKYPVLKNQFEKFQQQINDINASDLSNEEKSKNIEAIKQSESYKTINSQILTAEGVFKGFNITFDTADQMIEKLSATLDELNSAYLKAEKSLSDNGLNYEKISQSITEINNGINKINKAKIQLENTLKKLENGEIELEKAKFELEKQKTTSIFKMSSALSEISVNKSALSSALSQINQGKEALEQAKETTLKSSDLTNIISKEMVSNIISAQNFSMPAGYVLKNDERFTVNVGEEFNNIGNIENLVLLDLQIDGIKPIKISDVATVEFTNNSDDVYAKVNRENGIVLSFQKQSTYATAEVSDNISEKFNELKKEYKNISFLTLMDQGDYIYMITSSLFESLIYGAIFAVLILFLFLKDIKPTIITLCSIPLSVVFTVVLMYFSGISINMMSLAGLAISVGMLVDNSVVVIENIYRLKSLGVSSVKAAVSGATQVAGAIIASTITTICVFLPIVFVEGITRDLFTDMALTITYSLLASLIIALTLVPTMSSRMLKKAHNKENKTITRLTNVYKKLLNKSLSHKLIVLSLAIVLMISSCVLSFMKGFIFMPETETNQISVTLKMPNKTKFDTTKQEADKILDKILSVDEVEEVGALASDERNVTYYITLKENGNISSKDVGKTIEKLCKGSKAEINVNSGSALSSQQTALTGSGVSVKLHSNNLDELKNTAEKLTEYLKNTDGVETVTNSIDEKKPLIKIVVDKNKAMKYNLTVAQVYGEITKLLTENVKSTTASSNGEFYTIKVSQSENNTTDFEALKNYKLKIKDNQNNEKEIKLISIADIIESESLSAINRENQKRTITVSASVEDGENITLVSNNIENRLKDFEFSDEVNYELDGENESIMESIIDLFKMLLIGIALVYLVMVAQFQSLKSPFVVMFTIPLALTGGLGALLLCNKEISVVSMMGFILLCGVIVNNGIVLVDYINQLRIGGMKKQDAIITAGATRLRPILMTTITTVLGLLIMALGLGSGNDMMQPVAIVCIGGLLYATLLTLFVIPIIYDLMNRKEIKTIDEKELEITND